MKNNSSQVKFKNMKNKGKGCRLNKLKLKTRSIRFNKLRNSWNNNFIFWKRRKKA